MNLFMRAKKTAALLGPLLLIFLLTTACAEGDPELPRELRDYYEGLRGCTATVALSADFGDRVQDFTLKLTYRKDGDATVEVLSPEEIAGITARVGGNGGQLLFDGVVLETGPLPGGGVTPMDALPTLLGVWRGGYLTEHGEERLDGERVLHLVWKDTVGDAEVSYHGWFERETFRPVKAEILSDGAAVIRCDFELFETEE